MGKKLSFIIPCYRSENTISEGAAGIVREYSGRDYDFEVILVNDSSPDNTYGVIRQLCDEDKRIKGINLSRNFGQHSAIMAGLNQAHGDIIVLLDDDGQTPPDQAIKLISQVEAGHDAAIASYRRKKHSLARNLGSKVNEKMACWLIGKPKGLYLSSYVAMKRFVAEEILSYKLPYPYLSGIYCGQLRHCECGCGAQGKGGRRIGLHLLQAAFALVQRFYQLFDKTPQDSHFSGRCDSGAGFARGIYSSL
jgi:undecaprenyl-phosphate 4-deoxy-4-formamido-L-arabinose transferase